MRKKILSCLLILFAVCAVNGQVSNNQAQEKQIQKKKVAKKSYPKSITSSTSIKKNIQNKTTSEKTYSNIKSPKISLNGQWRGYFNANGDIVSSDNDNVEYVLELDIQGTKVSGYSYSYFQDRSFYVICSLDGEYNKQTKSLTVTETARVKGATPPGWDDCLQTHTLTYKKEGDTEELTGTWKMAPGQIGDCGFGNTTLVRRTLKKDLASYNKSANSTTPFSAPKQTVKTAPKIAYNKKTETHPVVKYPDKPQTPVIEQQVVTVPQVTKNIPDNTPPQIESNEPSKTIITPTINYEKRNNELMKTVEINHETFRVALYDNGVIDGDSISLFYNGKLILSHQRLSDTAITLTLNVNTNKPVNELIMYAENLGEIPPNTALMVVTDGENRYEVPVTSDLQTSGMVHFIFKPKNQ